MGSSMGEGMKSHKDLLEEAEELAADMKQGQKIDWSFKHLYVVNHELGYLTQAVEHLRDKMNLVWNFLMATVVAIGIGLAGVVIVALAKWIVG